MRFFLFVLAALILASPAHAGPLVAAIPLIVGLAATSLGATAIVSSLIIAGTSLALSALVKTKKSTPARAPGISIQTTLSGGTNSRTIPLGLYATAGSATAPPMSHGSTNDTPNSFLTKIITLSDVPIDGFSRLIINGEYVNVGTDEEYYGFPIYDKYSGYAWIKFYDGRQTTVDPMLSAQYGSYIRPWDTDRIGIGSAYVILTFLYNTEIYKSVPDNLKFEIRGMRLYDIRKDSTIGGSGSHRWDNPSTWEITLNPIVMIYNILRGIELADGLKYGGECIASDLPVANWVAGMNVCDETVPTLDGTQSRYRAGYEIAVANEEPASAIEQLLNACSASIVETGGIYKVRVGAPSLPVMFLTDKDFLVTNDKDLNPFPGIAVGSNTVNATYPSPEEGWVPHDAPDVTNQDYIDADDGQIISTNLTLNACPYPIQVQRLMLGWLKDDRRWRQHTLSIGHYAYALEPLDTIAWTSAANGYSSKVFEINSTGEDTITLEKRMVLREVDPADYDWSSDDQLPDPATPGQWELPAAQAVPGFSVSAIAIKDDDGVNRRPALLVVWSVSAAIDATALKIQVRNATTLEAVTDVTITRVSDGETIISQGILPVTSYEVRAIYIVDRATVWSSWLSVTTGDIRLGGDDISGYDELISNTADALDKANDALAEAALLADRILTAEGEIVTINDTISLQNTEIIEVRTLAETTEGDLASLTTTVSTQDSRITTTETAIDTVESDVASLTTEVSTQGASITSNTTAISNLDSDVTSLASEVTTISTQVDDNTATITEQALSIDGIFAHYGITIDVNGLASGFSTNNDGITSDFRVAVDLFSLEKPGGGERTEFSDGNWRIYDSAGTLRIEMGVNL